jgi:hypothetical protein
MVNCHRPGTGHDAKEPRFVVPSPASDAGTNRHGHRIRLTRQRVSSIPIAYGAVRSRLQEE